MLVQAHQFTEDGEVVVSGPAGESDAAEEAAPLDRCCRAAAPALLRHDAHPGGVVGRVALAVGQQQPLAEGALESARRPRVAEHDAVFPPQPRIDLVFSLGDSASSSPIHLIWGQFRYKFISRSAVPCK